MRGRSAGVVFRAAVPLAAFLLVVSSACAPVAGTLPGRPTADIRKTGEKRAEEGSKAVVTKPVESGRGASENAPGGKSRLDRSIEGFTREISADPGRAETYNDRGFAYAKKNQYDLAVADYNKALELNPRFDAAYYNRGNAFYQQGFYDLAIADYTKALEYNPKYDRAFNNRGNSYYQTGRYDQAIADYARALEVNPNYDATYYNLANAYYQKSDYGRAIAEYTRAVERNPRSDRAYNNRAAAFILANRLADAEHDINKALELNPEDGSIMVRMAELYAAKKDVVEACRWLKKGVKKGYADQRYLKTSSTFDNIRRFPCFDAILARR